MRPNLENEKETTIPQLLNWELNTVQGVHKLIGDVYGSPDWPEAVRILTPELIKEQVIIPGGIVHCKGGKMYKLAKRKGT